MGKSLYVKRMAKSLKEKFKMPVAYPPCVTISVHVPNIDFDEVMESLVYYSNPVNPYPQIFHFDISPSVRNVYTQWIIYSYYEHTHFLGTGRCGCFII